MRNDTFHFQVKRLERLLTVFIGRTGIFKFLEWILNCLLKITKK